MNHELNQLIGVLDRVLYLGNRHGGGDDAGAAFQIFEPMARAPRPLAS
jgi:hypothetical protein